MIHRLLNLRLLAVFVGSCFASLTASSVMAEGGVCPCVTDIDASGGMDNIIDVLIVKDCAEGICGSCTNDCDIDCDGDVDYIDMGAASCSFQGFSNCCDLPSGACIGADLLPTCVVTTEVMCTANTWNGTYAGDGTICVGDNAVDTPAASTWGLVAMALLLLTFGCLVMRGRRLDAIDS